MEHSTPCLSQTQTLKNPRPTLYNPHIPSRVSWFPRASFPLFAPNPTPSYSRIKLSRSDLLGLGIPAANEAGVGRHAYIRPQTVICPIVRHYEKSCIEKSNGNSRDGHNHFEAKITMMRAREGKKVIREMVREKMS